MWYIMLTKLGLQKFTRVGVTFWPDGGTKQFGVRITSGEREGPTLNPSAGLQLALLVHH